MQPPQGGYGYGPPPGGYGYGAPPPQPKKGVPVGLVLVLCIAGGFVLLVVVGAVIGFMRVRDRINPDPAKVVLSERYESTNGFIIAHYPADFAAKRIDRATVLVSRGLGLGDEFVTLGALPLSEAVTDDIEEFARLMLVSVEKNVENKGGTSTRGKGHDAKCLGKYDGIEYAPTFTLPTVGEYVGKACFFIRKKRAFVIRYDVVKSQAKGQVPLLEKIVDATELGD